MGVTSNIVSLIHELTQRTARMIAMLEKHQPHPDIAGFHRTIIDHLTLLQADIRHLLRTDDLLHPSLIPYVMSDYQEYARQAFLIEQWALPVILKYDERDHQWTQVVRALLREMQFPADLTPYVTATSDQYYWAKPEFGVIGVPVGDFDGILGWPDLLHELAHLLLHKWLALLQPLTQIVHNHFRTERNLIGDIGGSLQDSQVFAAAEIKWGEQQEGTWRIELACDSIATYLVGASYGWQHIRLAANLGSDPYQPSPGRMLLTHPADQARLDTIVATLQLLGRDADANEVNRNWRELRNINWPSQLPPGYDQYYPPTLIRALAHVVVNGCQQRNVTAFTDQRHHANLGVIPMIDQAWRTFRSNPSGYATWERQAVGRLRDALQTTTQIQQRAM